MTTHNTFTVAAAAYGYGRTNVRQMPAVPARVRLCKSKDWDSHSVALQDSDQLHTSDLDHSGIRSGFDFRSHSEFSSDYDADLTQDSLICSWKGSCNSLLEMDIL
jgi:hypothetical protein